MIKTKHILVSALLLGLNGLAIGQTKKGDTAPVATAATASTATPPKAPEPPKTGPKPYKEVITDKAKTSKGMFTVHKLDDKYYFELADSLLNREIMMVTRYSKTATIPGTYGGEQVSRTIVSFEKAPENKLFMRAIQYINMSPDSTAPMYKAVRNSNVQPIAQAFEVKAIKTDSVTKQKASVIDMTEFLREIIKWFR